MARQEEILPFVFCVPDYPLKERLRGNLCRHWAGEPVPMEPTECEEPLNWQVERFEFFEQVLLVGSILRRRTWFRWRFG